MKKQSKLSVLLNNIYTFIESKQLDSMGDKLFDKWIGSCTDEEIATLADTIGYWNNSGDYRLDLDVAKKKMERLYWWYISSTITKGNCTFYWYFVKAIYNYKNFNLSIRIKLLLHHFVHYKNFRVVNKYLHKTTGLNALIIEKQLKKIILDSNFTNYTDVTFSGIDEFNLIHYLNYYYESDSYASDLIQNTLIEKSLKQNDEETE